MTPSLRRCILAVALVGGFGPAMVAQAQQSAPPPAQAKAVAKKQAEAKVPKADPAAAQAEVENGVNALAQGRVDAAVASLNNALSASSLPQNQTARALYYRGVAYRRQAKPAQAISDLTNALWIKGGLTEEQRQDALQQRSGAYREAGLPDQSDPGGQRAVSAAKGGPQSAPFASVAPPPPTGSSTTMSASGGGFFGSLFGGSAPTPPPQPTTTAVPSAPTTTASVAPRVASGQQPGAKAAVSQSSAVQPAGSLGQGDKPATRMVPVMNAGSSLPAGFQEIAEPLRMVEVSTTARAGQPDAGTAAVVAPAQDTTKAPPVAPGRSGGKDGAKAQVKTAVAGQVQPSQPVAAVPQAAPASTPSRTASGGAVPAPRAGAAGVRIQVAAVRTAEEAQGLSTKLQAQYARELGGRAPVVDQVSAGNFGSFYRVQVGPFAATRETGELCEKLKSGGLDCRLVSQ